MSTTKSRKNENGSTATKTSNTVTVLNDLESFDPLHLSLSPVFKGEASSEHYTWLYSYPQTDGRSVTEEFKFLVEGSEELISMGLYKQDDSSFAKFGASKPVADYSLGITLRNKDGSACPVGSKLITFLEKFQLASADVLAKKEIINGVTSASKVIDIIGSPLVMSKVMIGDKKKIDPNSKQLTFYSKMNFSYKNKDAYVKWINKNPKATSEEQQRVLIDKCTTKYFERTCEITKAGKRKVVKRAPFNEVFESLIKRCEIVRMVVQPKFFAMAGGGMKKNMFSHFDVIFEPRERDSTELSSEYEIVDSLENILKRTNDEIENEDEEDEEE